MLKRVYFALLAVSLALIVPWLLLSAALGAAVQTLLWLLGEGSGEGAWYRRQRHHMESERPLLPDAEFLRSEGIGSDDAPLWLAVRRAMANSVGLPCECLYPEDRLADLWRMQWGVPDLLDVVLRLERALGVRINREAVDRLRNAVRLGPEGEFRQFAAAVAGELRGALNRAAV